MNNYNWKLLKSSSPFDCIHGNIDPFLLQARKDFMTFFWGDNFMFFLAFLTEIQTKVKQMNWTKTHKQIELKAEISYVAPQKFILTRKHLHSSYIVNQCFYDH